jgi:hypothetical protein
MTINKLTRLTEQIYNLNYVNMWGVYKEIKVYKHVFRWKKLNTGKDLSFNISSSLDVMATDLSVNVSILSK